jgi:hypothetical protein
MFIGKLVLALGMAFLFTLFFSLGLNGVGRVRPGGLSF